MSLSLVLPMQRQRQMPRPASELLGLWKPTIGGGVGVSRGGDDAGGTGRGGAAASPAREGYRRLRNRSGSG
jgi:hypothetical protein